jgi:hypothetical protein
MPDTNSSWNTDARIFCEFSFKCPQQWALLQPTAVPTIRYCSACDREVHLALTEEDLRHHADGGQCVAVRVWPDAPKEAEVGYVVGSPGAPYGSHLKKTDP